MITVACNLCGRDEWRLRFPATMNGSQPVDASAFRCTHAGYGHHAQIVQCRHCGHVYANPRWTAAELLSAYTAVEDETYLAEQAGRELTFRRHLQALEQVTGPANGRELLDVGAYTGVFVEVALARGWRASGIEPSAWAVEIARARGLPVVQGTQAAPELRGRQFDVITMWDVIEHVDDPSAELARSFSLLKPGGILAAHTMDIDSLAARLMGRRWPWLMDMHVHYFSRATLAAMMRRQGFEVLAASPQGRYLRLGYLATRLGGLNAFLGQFCGGVVERLGLAGVAVPVNFGDLFTIVGRRP